jgi:hypothetical protein
MEDKVTFPSGDLTLEGLASRSNPAKGVVVTHPHPLYGGDMHNPVVEAIAAAYRKAAYTTLRFNFRGTGSSAGGHDQGVGEQADVAAAIAFLQKEGCSSVHLSGYSFGAWVNAMALHNGLEIDGLTMVAPPVAFIEFAPNIRLPHLTKVVAGSRDEFAPPERIQPLLESWNRDASMEIIDGADHFFFGFLDEITRKLLAP